MAIEENETAPEVETSLRDDISAAIEQTSAPADVETPEPVEQPDVGKEKPRDETGKFAKAEAEEKPEPKEPTPPADAKAAPEKKDGLSGPANWPKGVRDEFARLPKSQQDFMLKRYKEMEGDYTRKTAEVATLKRDAEVSQLYAPVHEMFKPYSAMLAQAGRTPAQLIDGWMKVEQRFMNGDGANALRDIAKAYNIDLGKIAAPAQQQAMTPAEQRLAAIEQRILTEDQRKEQAERQAQQTEFQNNLSTVEKFQTETDKDGNLLRPHYEAVSEHMAQLAWAARQAGKPVPPLQQLYETAVYANPELRDTMVSAQLAAAEAKRNAEAKAKAAKARSLGSSVTGGAAVGQAAKPNGKDKATLRDDIRAAVSSYEEGHA